MILQHLVYRHEAAHKGSNVPHLAEVVHVIVKVKGNEN
jgi:hypothetical protein